MVRFNGLLRYSILYVISDLTYGEKIMKQTIMIVAIVAAGVLFAGYIQKKSAKVAELTK